ncbi:MAG TPA: hypothetical protein VEO01_24705 [Pseudonocardiaceae bacterium]|nr:hypothetical protein [Pseudonocardiaceae bacterium]
MSRNIIELPGLLVSTHAGPRVPGQGRLIYQLTSLDTEQVMLLTGPQIVGLAMGLIVHLGVADCPDAAHLHNLRTDRHCHTCNLIAD